MLDGIDDALVGMAAGETKEFSAPLAGGDHEGENADCHGHASSPSRSASCPTLDDDFAQLASEFDTLRGAARRRDRAGRAQAKKFEQGVQARDKVLEHLLSTIEIPVPEGIVEAEVTRAPRG